MATKYRWRKQHDYSVTPARLAKIDRKFPYWVLGKAVAVVEPVHEVYAKLQMLVRVKTWALRFKGCHMGTFNRKYQATRRAEALLSSGYDPTHVTHRFEGRLHIFQRNPAYPCPS
jgi:hypothetical protein